MTTTPSQRAKTVVFDMLMREGYGKEIAQTLVDNPDRLHLSGKDAFALVEVAMRLPAGEDAVEPEGWREFIEECAAVRGKMVGGNTLSAKAKRLLTAAPRQGPGEGS